MNEKTPLYDLPCYPDAQPSAHRRNHVGIIDNFCGQPGSTVFFGGAGYGTYTTYQEARDAVPIIVLQVLRDKVVRACAEYEYAQEQLAQWFGNPEVFRAIRPKESPPPLTPKPAP